MIKRILISILVLAIVAGGVIFIFRGRIMLHYIPEVEQIGDIHIEIKNDTSYISSKLTVRNKTFLKIEIDTIKYTISLFNKAYLQNQKFIGMVLHGYGKDTMDFSLKIPYVALLKDLKAQRKIGDSASYAVNVSLQYSTVFGKAEIPINRSARLKIPQPPQLEVVEVKYRKVRFKSILATARIKITNFSAVALSIKSMSYAMKISEQGDLKGNFLEPIVIKPDGITFVEIPIEIDVDNIGKTIFQVIINKDQYNYTIKLSAILESSDPLKESFHLDLIQKGKMELKK